MNHIYKVIWNHAKHCYTVVSEITKNHSHSNKRVRSMTAVVAAAMMLTGFGGMAIEAANPANEDVNIAVGKGASTNTTMGNPPGVVSGYIAIGENAYAWNGGNPDGIGRKESYLDFNQGAVSPSSLFTKAKVTDGTKLAGAIAIGKNTVARTGSLMIGDHTYEGELGDIEVKSSQTMTLNNGVYSTTLGASSYNGGSMSAVTGAFSIISNNGSSTLYGAQNFGATIYGSLNSIESSKSSGLWTGTGLVAGNANSVLGFGNRTQNTNASLVWGTGNEVTNSIEDLKINNPYWHDVSASGAQQQIIDAMRSDQYAGGSVMAIGGGNKADWATYSQLLGVQNTLTGTENDVSKLTMINGYKNTVTNAQNTTVIGSNNNATNVKSTIIMGDENTLEGRQGEGRQGVISLGNKNKIDADDAVAIGNGTTVKAENGVAIGVGSVADRVAGSEKGAFAPDIIPDVAVPTWRSTAGAVSVGSSSMTRQIINVAAGTSDTDAVNVAQLKKALESIDVDAGAGIKVEKITNGEKTTYKISTNIVGKDTPTDTTTVTTNQTNTGSTGTSQGTTESVSTKTGNTVTVSTETKATSFGADGNQKADVKPGGTLNINGDGNNILTSISTSTSDNSSSIKVELNKDLNLSSVTTGDTKMDTNGLSIGNKTYVSNKGLNANDRKVTNVAAGDISEKSTDAVNGSQLFATNQQVAQNAQSISKLGNRINKVGAGAAALAALHPLDFDPDDKWDFVAGYGNYNGENAAAIGAYYRPNEDTMFSVGGSFGNGENMVNAGVSLKLGQGNHVSTSKVAMAKEIKDLRKELEGLKSALLDANAGKKLDTSKLQLFPDVPKNHWAYEYVFTLKGNGALTGYPDGEFKGDRPMTRYEFATMLYKAMLEGATLSDRILKEFAPELERFTVDTVHQDKDGKPTVERVRMVKAKK